MKWMLLIPISIMGAFYSCSKPDTHTISNISPKDSYFNFIFDGKTYNSSPQADSTRMYVTLGLNPAVLNGAFIQSLELYMVITNTKYTMSFTGNNFNLGTVKGKYFMRNTEIRGFTHQEDYYTLAGDTSSYIMLTDYSYEHNEPSEVKGTYLMNCTNSINGHSVTSTGNFDIFFTPR